MAKILIEREHCSSITTLLNSQLNKLVALANILRPEKHGIFSQQEAIESRNLMTKILIEREHCSFLITLLDENKEPSILVQTDWEYPAFASDLGWSPCDCGDTDGTVDCKHKTASQMICEAKQVLLDACGTVVEVDDSFVEYFQSEE